MKHLRSYRLFESAFQEVLYHGTDKTFDEFKLGIRMIRITPFRTMVSGCSLPIT